MMEIMEKMEKILSEIQKINNRFELVEQRLSSLEQNSKVTNRRLLTIDRKDIKENRIEMKAMGHSNFGIQDEPQPSSSRDVMEGDIVLNERDQLPGMFI